MTPTQRAALQADYDRTAGEYLKSLPLEHFMEATPQATQRSIFMAAFEQIHDGRPDVHHFNEMLVQYDFGRPPTRRRVVPDNMVVVHDGPIDAVTNYAVELQPARPLLMLEYVSKGSERKDYEDNHRKYECELKVPYYLLFYPDAEEMTLFRRGKTRYSSVVPNEAGRHPIPEIEVEAGLLDGWVRFWFRGEMRPRTAELRKQLHEKDRALVQEREANARLQARLAQAEAALQALQHRPPS